MIKPAVRVSLLALAYAIACAGYASEPIDIPTLVVPMEDLTAVEAEDQELDQLSVMPRFALPYYVSLTPETDGAWQDLGNGMLRWQLRVACPGAQSLNFGFAEYFMPPGGYLRIFERSGGDQFRPFTFADNQAHGQLWTPVIRSDEAILEVVLPADEREQLRLTLDSVNRGYRFFQHKGKDGAGVPKQGACHIDVICPQADDWRNEVNAVALYTIGGFGVCSGWLANNTDEDERPLFMTADHCGVDSGNANSVVVYWRFESPTCGALGGGALTIFQAGATHLASHEASDHTLLELNTPPPDEADAVFAGWDRTTANPAIGVGIHHPGGDEKAISFDNDPLVTTSEGGFTSPGDGNFLRVTWDEGVTEPGSSGSPIFNENRRAAGVLTSGASACSGNGVNGLPDWYGRLSSAWQGDGTPETRVRDYLDPGDTGVPNLDALGGVSGVNVTPKLNLDLVGPIGGPFTQFAIYSIQNTSGSIVEYEVTASKPWVSLSPASGLVPSGGIVQVTVAINSQANSLPGGLETALLSFVNKTDGKGNTTRLVNLIIEDCNGNGIADSVDISNGAADCNSNDIPDDCDIASGLSTDCNNNGVVDECDTLTPIVFTTQPLDTIAIQGASATLSAAAVGDTEVSYQWLKSNVAIPGATGPTLIIPTVKVTDTGNYTVEATTGCQKSISNVARITVVSRLGVSTTASKVIAAAGQLNTLSAVASGGVAPYSFAWSTGATTPSIEVSPIATTTFLVTVRDAIGQEGSAVAVGTVAGPVTVSATASPSGPVAPNELVTLVATSTFSVAPVSYAWSTGATTASATVRPQTTTTYTVVATDPLGQQATASVTVTVSGSSSPDDGGDGSGDGDGDGDADSGGGDGAPAGPVLCTPGATAGLLPLMPFLARGMVRRPRRQ